MVDLPEIKMTSKGTNETEDRLIQLTINGKLYKIGSDVPPSTTLLTFIRDHAHLKGTKACCYQGNCGVCTVVATTRDPQKKESVKTFSVRACTTLLYSCHGWAVATIEYLGDRYKGYHSLQKALTGFYGTQCGFCSPGFVMSMYGELKQSGGLTAESVEKNLDGNLCRCTGYRPIMDAFKSLSVNATDIQRSQLRDIEDAFMELSSCYKNGTPCGGTCGNTNCKRMDVDEPKHLQYPFEDLKLLSEDMSLKSGNTKWFRPVTLQGVYEVLRAAAPTDKFKLVVGNTGAGVFPEEYNAYIDITGVEELNHVSAGTTLVLGANVTLTRCIDVFNELSSTNPSYGYLKQLALHWGMIANVGIRNVSSWAGNLMLKHAYNEFPSDIFLTLVAAEATLKIGKAADSSTTIVSVEEFLNVDMVNMVIIELSLPPFEENDLLMSYKIGPTAVNSLAHVDAAFKLSIDRSRGTVISKKPSILFGGIRSNFVHASTTENFLTGSDLRDDKVLQEVMTRLKSELKPTINKWAPSAEYRSTLAQALFYKAVASILGNEVSPFFRSAAGLLSRPLSTGNQAFDANRDTWPVGQALPKLESSVQVAGEAEYLDDMEPLFNEVHGAFVQTSIAKGRIKFVDPSLALKVSGVVDYISHLDIVGTNTFPFGNRYLDPVFVEASVSYCGQPVGLVVANTREIAIQAAKLVKIQYENVQKPILTIEEALKPKNSSEVLDKKELVAPHKVSGVLNIGSQHPLYTEPLAARVIPVEDGYDVFITSQDPTSSQGAVAQILKIPHNKINLTIRRIGGGFGGKIDRGQLPACAAAVAAQKLKRPVRVVLDINDCMTLVGWREPFLSKYEAGFDDLGKLSYVNVDFISDSGHVKNNSSASSVYSIPGVYFAEKWLLNGQVVTTDTAANTYVRAPGTPEALATMENIIEHVATVLDKDPVKVREVNFIDSKQKSRYGPRGKNLAATKIFPMLKEQTMFDMKRQEVDEFNRKNRWVKRGVSMIPMLYGYDMPKGMRYNVQVVIYAADGSVVITHGGIEMGQGINTKAAQVAAKILGCPLSNITVKPANVITGANSSVSAGSMASDGVAHAIRVACQKIADRLAIVKREIHQDLSWLVMIKYAQQMDLDICERYWTNSGEYPKGYDIFGSAFMEVEIDVLTGQHLIRRADIIEDAGRSLNPYVDIGQIEGCFVMGLGLYTSEEVKYDPQTGRKLTNRLLNYHPPFALDIPVDFRVTLLPNGDNSTGVLRSKATGEPAVLMSYVFVTTLRDAVKSARADAGVKGWFDMHMPITAEKIQQLCLVDGSQFKIHETPKENHSLEEESFLFVNEKDIEQDQGMCSLN